MYIYLLYKFDRRLYMCSPVFFSKISIAIESELSWLVSEALVCPIFLQTNPVDWFKGDCYGIVFEFVDVILVWVRSFCILQVLDRRWKMPKPQVPDVRCRVKGCWCPMMLVGRFRADLQWAEVATMYPQGFRSLKEITTCFPWFFGFIIFLKSFRLERQPLFCNHFCPERPSFKECALKWNCLRSHWLEIIWANATWLR